MSNLLSCALSGSSDEGSKGLVLTVTCDSVFAGEIISCSDGNTTLTQTCPSSSPYTVSFSIPSAGTWTISSGTSSTVFTVPDSVNLHQIPVGSTVTPVNDIQTWLHCADIWDKNYTMLDEVLVDASTLQALISSNNAANYMARSMAFADEVIPIMTSDTTPSGNVTSSGSYAGAAYLAFDRSDTTAWSPMAGTTSQSGSAWIQYEFANEVDIGGLKWISGNVSIGDKEYPYVMTIEVSTDGTTFTPIHTYTQTESNITPEWHSLILDNVVSARYLKISYDRRNIKYTNSYYYTHLANVDVFGAKQTEVIPNNANAMTYIGANNYCADALLAESTWRNAICDSTYLESVLNVKVPTMTSNTAPSGEAFASTELSSNYAAYKAFASSGEWIPTGGQSNNYCGYDYGSSKRIYKVSVYLSAGSANSFQFKLQGSNSGKNAGIVDIETRNITTQATAVFNLDGTMYRYIRLFCASNQMHVSGSYSTGYHTFKIYGRQDV